uniref:Uncharacterized protein n=1 Tax=Craspedostauros australis TaxID=1486917 RepID=A0A6T6GPK9_9STRA
MEVCGNAVFHAVRVSMSPRSAACRRSWLVMVGLDASSGVDLSGRGDDHFVVCVDKARRLRNGEANITTSRGRMTTMMVLLFRDGMIYCSDQVNAVGFLCD